VRFINERRDFLDESDFVARPWEISEFEVVKGEPAMSPERSGAFLEFFREGRVLLIQGDSSLRGSKIHERGSGRTKDKKEGVWVIELPSHFDGLFGHGEWTAGVRGWLECRRESRQEQRTVSAGLRGKSLQGFSQKAHQERIHLGQDKYAAASEGSLRKELRIPRGARDLGDFAAKVLSFTEMRSEQLGACLEKEMLRAGSFRDGRVVENSVCASEDRECVLDSQLPPG
jgi:hypothetical protein